MACRVSTAGARAAGAAGAGAAAHRTPSAFLFPFPSHRGFSTLRRSGAPTDARLAVPAAAVSVSSRAGPLAAGAGASSGTARTPPLYSSAHSGASVGAVRALHASAPAQSTVLIAGLSVGAAALAARFALQAFGGSKAEGKAGEDGAAASSSDGAKGTTSSSAKEGGGAAAGEDAAARSHKGYGAEFWAKQLYKGGFDDKMSRREAALILGVRESADPKRIQERHRKMLIANHPDVGGSTYIAGKINEAKDLLLNKSQGKSS